MDFGFAAIDITPPPGEELTGYGYYLNRRATGAADPIMARALALSDGDTRAVVVQLDLLALDPHWVSAMRARVERKLGLPGDCLMLHCTHTHSGPAARVTFGCGRPSEHFMHALGKHILQITQAALADLKPAGSVDSFDVDFPEGFAHNRVGGTDLDTRVRGLNIVIPGARPILVVNYACHPVTLGVNREYSADYPGALIRELNAYGCRAIFLTGPCGDINPLANTVRVGPAAYETLGIYGRDLAACARSAVAESLPWEPGPLRVFSRAVSVMSDIPEPVQLEASLEELQAKLEDDPDNGLLRVDMEWHLKMLEDLGGEIAEEEARAEIQGFVFGNAAVVALSAETFTALGQIIRDAAPEHNVLLAATSNGVIGYIADRRDVDLKGYASLAACKLYGMALPLPGAGEAWASEGAALLADTIEGK